MQILIVDDDSIALDILRETLESEGYQVLSTTSGREALEILAQGSVQLVISDWEMPDINGLQLCRTVRERSSCGYIYLILLTGRESRCSTVDGLAAGADDFIAKPFNPPELLARVRVAERLLALETRDLTIFAMAKLAESRDPETGTHLERVQAYSRILAEQMSRSGTADKPIGPTFCRLIHQTSPLHDIGKVAIPDSVLLKAGRLSDDEFDVMKTHTTLGAQTLEAAAKKHPNAEFLRMAIEIAASHHERFDGTGYPNKLKGYDIPLSGRIVALADVYDALTSKRVYKAAFAHSNARAIIAQGAGKHFDPAVFSAFLANEQEFQDIQDEFSEHRRAAA